MHIDKNNQPLVSIIVITYNSARFVLETLESAKAQTYQNIELIVSDDCSTDDTVKICMEWIEVNKNRFQNTKILTTSVNTGVASNSNRGLIVAIGEWVKFIAGDDSLEPSCLEDYINACILNPNDIKIMHSNMLVYADSIKPDCLLYTKDYSSDLFNNRLISAKEQNILLSRQVFIGAPSVIFKRDVLLKIGGLDETMPYEDWPIFLKLTYNNYKIHFLNKATVNYRIHNSSMFNKYNNSQYIFNSFFLKDRVVFQKYRRQNLSRFETVIEDFEFIRKKLFLKFDLNKATAINRFLNLPFIYLYFFIKGIILAEIKRKILKSMERYSIQEPIH